MKNSKKLLLGLLSLTMLGSALGGTVVAQAETKKADPTVNTVNGVMGVIDNVVYGEDESVEMTLLASAGYGTRALFANLGEYNTVDVKDFSCEIDFDVAVNISTVISLQTVETGTIGAGNGNGVHVLFRNEYDGFMSVAVYDQTGAITYFATELGAFQLNDERSVNLSIQEEENVYTITVSSGENVLEIANETLNEGMETAYADYDYKGYVSISSYYMAQVDDAEAKYSVKKINGMTTVAWERSIVSSAIKEYENAVAQLSEESSQEDIASAVEKNIFDAEIWNDLIAKIDDGTLQSRIDAADTSIARYANKLEYEKTSAAIAAFKTSVESYNKDDTSAVAAARQQYAKIDSGAIKALGAPYADMLTEELNVVKALPNFKTFMSVEAEHYVTEKESSVKDNDAKDLKTYKSLDYLTTEWNQYVEDNALTTLLGQATVDAYTARIQAVASVKENSFYNTLWTEGDTWNAELVDGEGLYASGEGNYGQTLGFNQKLEVGKNTEITFNVIYALKRLGANHLHIGFYPEANTGTFGKADGVRVDFWFAGSSIDIKAVNGKTETDIYDTAYITVEDMGFYEPEYPDPDAGKYTVKLYTHGDILVVNVNGLEMDIVGLTPELYKDGCYMTVSAMSVRGAEYNQIMITKLGDTDYTDYSVNAPVVDDNSENEGGKDEKGCKSSLNGQFVGGATVLSALAFVLLQKTKKLREEKERA